MVDDFVWCQSNVFQVQFWILLKRYQLQYQFADNLSVGEMKFPAALFSKTSTLPKFSKLLVAYFPLLHNDAHHIESVGMFHLFPFPVLQQYF
jgi:hypothetical protein